MTELPYHLVSGTPRQPARDPDPPCWVQSVGIEPEAGLNVSGPSNDASAIPYEA